MLRDYEGYSYKEIGEITGLSELSENNIYRDGCLKNFIGKLKQSYSHANRQIKL